MSISGGVVGSETIWSSLLTVALVLSVAPPSSPASSFPCTATATGGYTTLDASILTEVAYTARFKLHCPDSHQQKHPPLLLYFSILEDQKINSNGDGKSLANPKGQVAVVSAGAGAGDGGQEEFLLSWTETFDTAAKGELTIQISSTSDKNQPASPVALLKVNHPGSYTGPWVSSELMAVAMGSVFAYVAISGRSRF